MKHTIIRLIALGWATGVIAATVGDDFNDNSKDTTKWGSDELYGNGTLVETGQRLEYRCNTGTADDDDIRQWVGNAGPYNADWEMQLDLVNTTTLTLDNQINSYGLKIRSPLTSSSEVIVELYNSSLGGLPSRRGFNGEIQENDTYLTSGDTGEAGVTSGKVRLAFNSTTKVFTCYYATNGTAWIALASFGVAGAGGTTTNSDWGLSETDTFPIFVYGYSANMTVGAGTMHGDNLSITGGVGGGAGACADLTGTWTNLVQTCKYKNEIPACKIKGQLLVQNIGTAAARTSFVRYYLSSDGTLDEGDALLKQVATGSIKLEKLKKRTLSAKLPAGVNGSGQFLIAAIDADATLAECAEDNNVIVIGPLP